VRDFPALAKTAFNADELACFERNPVAENFYGLWTAKEAAYKAGQPCRWLGRLSFKQYRVAAALPLTGLQNLVIW
jgi:phosphopantetheinyl transferase (holo-ACP synthase)